MRTPERRVARAYAGHELAQAARGPTVWPCLETRPSPPTLVIHADTQVESTLTDAAYFASPCKFGPNGVEEVLPFGELSAYEKGWFDKMLPELKAQIQKGIDFAK